MEVAAWITFGEVVQNVFVRVELTLWSFAARAVMWIGKKKKNANLESWLNGTAVATITNKSRFGAQIRTGNFPEITR